MEEWGALTVVVVDDLEVFDRGLGDAAVEVEHVGLGVVIPDGRLVVQLDQVVQRVILPPAQEALLLLQHTHRDVVQGVPPTEHVCVNPPQIHCLLNVHAQ